jgi:hypothetical protein
MTSQLITSWAEYDGAIHEILQLSTGTLQIFDEDLSALRLERAERMARLRALLATREHPKQLTIIVQRPDFVRQYSPQLMELLTVYTPALTIIHSPPHLDRLKDSLLIANGQHALVRFHRDHARARLILDDAAECAPYVQRFAEILGEGGDPLSPTTLGL